MNLSKFLVRDAIRCNLFADDKIEAIALLITALSKAKAISVKKTPTILKSAIQREELGSTAIGHGIALPRAKCDTISEPMLSIGIFPDGVDFESLDGTRVYAVFLTVAGDSSGHAGILGEVVSFVRENWMRRQLLEAKSAPDILELVDEWTLTRAVASI